MIYGLVGNKDKTELGEVAGRVLRILTSSGAQVLVHRDIASTIRGSLPAASRKLVSYSSAATLVRKASMVVSLGGDGTILRTARMVGPRQIPIVGVNIGKLGFLAEISTEQIDNVFEEILRGEYTTEDRMMLLAEGKGLGKGYAALNDIVMDLSGSARVIHVETRVNGEFLARFTGDGIIVSTPTGSTGYALSNGGPIVSPRTAAIMVSPICPHTLSARPVILPDSVNISLRVQSAPARVHVTTDGQPELFFRAPVEVHVRKAPFVTKLVKRKGSSYYDVLREKLQWGRDVRTDRGR